MQEFAAVALLDLILQFFFSFYKLLSIGGNTLTQIPLYSRHIFLSVFMCAQISFLEPHTSMGKRRVTEVSLPWASHVQSPAGLGTVYSVAPLSGRGKGKRGVEGTLGSSAPGWHPGGLAPSLRSESPQRGRALAASLSMHARGPPALVGFVGSRA